MVGLLSGMLAFSTTLVQAETYNISQFKPSNVTVSDNPTQVGSNIIGIVFVTAAIIALGFLIWGAIGFITSGGDSGKLESARGKMIFAAIGLILVGSTWAIFVLITRVTFGTENISIPSINDSGSSGGGDSDAVAQCKANCEKYNAGNTTAINTCKEGCEKK